MPKSPEWLAEFNRTIGGSRAAAVLGKSRFSTPAQVYAEMFEGAVREDLSDNPDIRRGELLEPIAVAELKRQVGIDLDPWPQDNFIYNQSFPWAHALPDAVAPTNTALGEVKVPRPTTWQRMYLQGVPEDYQIQAQHQMLVSGVALVHFAALCPVTMKVLYVPIARNEEAIGEIMEGERRFWEMAQNGHKPEKGDIAPTFELPPVEGSLITLDTEQAVKAACAYVEAKALMDEVESIVNSTKADLLSLAGNAEAFEVAGVLRCYNKLQAGRTTFDSKAALAKFPHLSEFQKQGKPFTTFRAYPLNQRKGE